MKRLLCSLLGAFLGFVAVVFVLAATRLTGGIAGLLVIGSVGYGAQRGWEFSRSPDR